MEENEYRSTYHAFNPLPCSFEKSILSRQSQCPGAHKFCLAEREGVSCQDPATQLHCQEFLQLIRSKASFALKLTRPGESLPHAKEIRIQLGSLAGLNDLLNESPADAAPNAVEDIAGLLRQTTAKFPDLAQLPVDLLIQHISRYKGRQRRRKGEKT